MRAFTQAVFLTAVTTSIACFGRTDDGDGGSFLCAGEPCASGFCHETTGLCASGECCARCLVSDPREESCDESRCWGWPDYCARDCKWENGLSACVCDPVCPVDFVCNQFPTPSVCEAVCVTQRCTPDTAYCNQTTGACEERLPDTRFGEVGAPCTTVTECYLASGLQCYTETDFGYPGGYCSKACSTDLDCPSGSVCDGICWDACDAALGDCLPGHSCQIGDGGGQPVCVP